VEFVLRHKKPQALVSIILCDWSCRESFHALDYLREQTLPRETYEILWIEFYNRKAEGILRRIERAERRGGALPVDSYAVMGMPEEVCYHKHAMYNLGILLSGGTIVCICDSDAAFPPQFVQSIVEVFKREGPVVLHMDEVRNDDRRFWPFRRQRFDDLTGPGCINWVDGRPVGLLDPTDPLHRRNYGACMCALREDLLAVGGADLHRDYLGHICGPYELTFRLRNFGRREIWHPEVWLYHVWHPNQGGGGQPLGPHDGLHMSTTALAYLKNGAWLPHVESPAVAAARQGEPVPEERLGEALLPAGEIENWSYKNLNSGSKGRVSVNRVAPSVPFGIRFRKLHAPRLVPLLCHLLWRQLKVKYRIPTRLPAPPGPWKALLPFHRARSLARFLYQMLKLNRERLAFCWRHLCYAKQLGIRQIILFGDETPVRILFTLSRFLKLRVQGVCVPESSGDLRSNRFPVISMQEAVRLPGTFLVASFGDVSVFRNQLEKAGIPRSRMILVG